MITVARPLSLTLNMIGPIPDAYAVLRECGPSHTDQYFSPTSSSTYEAVNCTECVHSPAATLACHGNRGCPISLSYVEGSHWDAMEVRAEGLRGQRTASSSCVQVVTTTTALRSVDYVCAAGS